MAKLLLSLIVLLSSSAVLADSWKPTAFDIYPSDEQKIIHRLNPVTDVNKSLVHLLFSGAEFSNCSIKAQMTTKGVMISLAHHDSKTAFGIAVDNDNALFSNIHFSSKTHVTYVVVSEQSVPTSDPRVKSVTYLMYFTLGYDGSIRELRVFSRINKKQKKSLFSRAVYGYDHGPYAVCR